MKLISKYSNSIFQSFDIIPDLKGKQIATNKAIEDIFKFLDIEITNRQLEFIFIELFKISNSINKLEYKKILEIFNKKYVPTDYIPFLDRKNEQETVRRQKSPKRMTEFRNSMVISAEDLMMLKFGIRSICLKKLIFFYKNMIIN